MEAVKTKICSKCGIEKDLTEFYKDKCKPDGYRTDCKICRIKRQKHYYQENLESIKKQKQKYNQENSEHIKKRSQKYYQENLESIKKQKQKYNQENSDHIKKQKQKYNQENLESIKKRKQKYNQENSEHIKQYKQKYSKENSEACRANNAYRRALKIQASPPWLNEGMRNEITELYAIAKDRTEVTGIEYHLDHIHPLNHYLICGLHIPANLQILTDKANLEKSNHFAPYVESECSYVNPWEV